MVERLRTGWQITGRRKSLQGGIFGGVLALHILRRQILNVFKEVKRRASGKSCPHIVFLFGGPMPWTHDGGWASVTSCEFAPFPGLQQHSPQFVLPLHIMPRNEQHDVPINLRYDLPPSQRPVSTAGGMASHPPPPSPPAQDRLAAYFDEAPVFFAQSFDQRWDFRVCTRKCTTAPIPRRAH